MVFFRKSLIAVFLLFTAFNFSCVENSGSNTFEKTDAAVDSLPPKFIASVISFEAAMREIGVDYQPIYSRIPDYDQLPVEFQLAYNTGYLIILDRRDIQFRALRRLLLDFNYTQKASPGQKSKEYFIPNEFYGTSMEVDRFLDGKAGDEMLDYFDVWLFIETNLDTLIKFNNLALINLRDQANALNRINDKADSLEKQIKQLELEIEALESERVIVKSQLDARSESFAPNAVVINFERRGRRPIIPYNKDKDFLRRVIEQNCDPIVGKSYDGRQVSTKYLHADLVKALDNVVKNEEKALKDIGLWPLKLASAGRSPLQQASLTNPIAAGMFSSGHVYCVSGDIAVAGTNYNDAKDHDKLKEILARHGISLPDNLRTKDPNHFFLGSFLNNKKFANSVRNKMLSGYYAAMQEERSIQNAKTDNLNDESKSNSENLKKLNEMIKAAQEKLDNLAKEKEHKEIQRKDKINEVNKTKDALAAKKEAERKRRNRSGDRPDRGSWGERNQKDGYWEKNTYREAHYNDGQRECIGRETVRENSRGDWSRERSIECRSNERGGGMGLP
jgi:hypothetical protein